jgi:hypothetical protein
MRRPVRIEIDQREVEPPVGAAGGGGVDHRQVVAAHVIARPIHMRWLVPRALGNLVHVEDVIGRRGQHARPSVSIIAWMAGRSWGRLPSHGCVRLARGLRGICRGQVFGDAGGDYGWGRRAEGRGTKSCLKRCCFNEKRCVSGSPPRQRTGVGVLYASRNQLAAALARARPRRLRLPARPPRPGKLRSGPGRRAGGAGARSRRRAGAPCAFGRIIASGRRPPRWPVSLAPRSRPHRGAGGDRRQPAAAARLGVSRRGGDRGFHRVERAARP